MRKRRKIKPMNIILHALFLIICAICIYPFLLILFNAISGEGYIVENGYVAWPKEISFAAFEMLMRMPQQLIQSTLISIVDAVGGPLFGIVVQSLAGYALTRDDFILQKPLKYYFMLALFLPAAGLIPTYIVNTEFYHLDNNILVYILPASVSAMGVFLYRTFFRTIPAEIIESARIDGATDMQIWSKMMLPLSKSFIATQFFLNLSGRWKDYTTSLYYMTEPELQNLEYYVQQVVKNVELLKNNAILLGQDASQFPAETMRFAVVFFALIPVMIIFPLMQKYFEKGATVGSVKG